MRAGRGECRRSQWRGGDEVGADVLVAQRPVGVQRDLGAEQVAGLALELEHVEKVPVVINVAAEPTGGREGQAADPVPGCQAGQLGGTRADLLFGGGWQVLRLSQWLAHAASLPVTTVSTLGLTFSPARSGDEAGER